MLHGTRLPCANHFLRLKWAANGGVGQEGVLGPPSPTLTCTLPPGPPNHRRFGIEEASPMAKQAVSVRGTTYHPWPRQAQLAQGRAATQ